MELIDKTVIVTGVGIRCNCGHEFTVTGLSLSRPTDVVVVRCPVCGEEDMIPTIGVSEERYKCFLCGGEDGKPCIFITHGACQKPTGCPIQIKNNGDIAEWVKQLDEE